MAFLQQTWSWALLLVLLPLLIHWLQIRRSKTLFFPGVHRLKRLTQSGQNPERLRHRWLLLFRSLAMLCLVLGFLWAMQKSVNAPTKRYHIAIDQSGSMRESGLAEKAKLELSRWLSAAPEDALFCLPQWGSQFLSAEQLKRKIQSYGQEWPRWSSQQFRLYAQEMRDPDARFYYLCDAYGQFEDSAVQCLVYGSEVPKQNAQIDTVYRWYSQDGPAYKVRLGLQGFNESDAIPELTLNDANGKPMQGLEINQRGEDWAEAIFQGALPAKGAWFQLSSSGWTFDDRLYLAAPQQPKLKVKSLGDHPFVQRWLNSYDGFERSETDIDLAYLSGSSANQKEWQSIQSSLQQGATVVCLDLESAEKLLNADFHAKASVADLEGLSASGLEHPLFRDVFREVGQNFNRKLPSFKVAQVPSLEALGQWELLLNTERGSPLYLLRREGMGRVFLWLGGCEADFVSSPWAVAIWGMPALQLAWADGPLYGVLGPQSVLPIGSIKPESAAPSKWILNGVSDSLVPEMRKRAGQWELPLNQEQMKPGLYDLQGSGNNKVIALNEPRLPRVNGLAKGNGKELPPWASLADDGSRFISWTALLLGLALLFLSIESVFVFLKERNEP
ncbi:MAG: hypothetical protein RL577_653 [Bacteroidota bacterium]|jgi:hypothetical protein